MMSTVDLKALSIQDYSETVLNDLKDMLCSIFGQPVRNFTKQIEEEQGKYEPDQNSVSFQSNFLNT